MSAEKPETAVRANYSVEIEIVLSTLVSAAKVGRVASKEVL